MLTSKTFTLQHSFPSSQDQLLILNNSQLALFFFQHNKYILYDYILQKTISQINLFPGTFSATLLESQQYLITLVPSVSIIIILNPQTGEKVKQASYQQSEFIPQVKLFGNNNFALVFNFGIRDKRLDIYIDFIHTRMVFCHNTIQQFNHDSLVSYSQIQPAQLNFTIIGADKQTNYKIDYNIKDKLIMKIIQHSQGQILVIYIEKSDTHFMLITLNQQKITHFFTLQNRRFLDLIIYNKKRELYVCFLWEDWNNLSGKQKDNIYLVQKKRNQESCLKINGFNVKSGVISNTIRKSGSERFGCHKYEQRDKRSEFQVVIVSSLRNHIVDVLTKSGIVKNFGSCIVRKVLSLRDY